MSGIVCAIRGGPSSRATVAQAIALARDTELPLHFLYVVNLDFLSRTTTSRISIILEQMRQMGESILLAAQEKANAQGIMAKMEVRHGPIGEEIASLCHELDADYLVLGRPELQREHNVFSQAQLVEFIRRLEKRTGAKVILPREDGS